MSNMSNMSNMNNMNNANHNYTAFGIQIHGEETNPLNPLPNKNGTPTQQLYIFANAFTWVSSQKDPSYYQILKEAKVFADGVGTTIACYIENKTKPKRLSGPNFSQRALETCNHIPMLFVGGTKTGMEKIVSKFKLKHCYQYIAPYREATPTNFQDDIKEIKKTIDTNKIEILWVCLGSPKQEFWGHLAKKSNEFPNAKIFPIGAAFDYLSQEKQRAPKIMQRLGLEWFHRLLSEPKRLFKRYLIGNSLLIYYCLKNKFIKK